MKFLQFGEPKEGFEDNVINERETRAAAGILLLFGSISFVNAYLLQNFLFTKIFVVFFMSDFVVRIFINTKYSPSLIMGRIMVQNQTPEYVNAKQKRWAWSLGLILSIIMFILIIILDMMTPIKIVICLTCLILLYTESVFGICIGCKLFDIFAKEDLKDCPGGVCEIREKEDIQKINIIQYVIFVTSVSIVIYITYVLNNNIEEEKVYPKTQKNIMKCGAGKCGGGMSNE